MKKFLLVLPLAAAACGTITTPVTTKPLTEANQRCIVKNVALVVADNIDAFGKMTTQQKIDFAGKNAAWVADSCEIGLSENAKLAIELATLAAGKVGVEVAQ